MTRKAILTLHPIPNEEQFSISASPGCRVLLCENVGLLNQPCLLIAEDALPPETAPTLLRFHLAPLDTPIDWDWTNSTVIGIVTYGNEPRCLMQVWE